MLAELKFNEEVGAANCDVLPAEEGAVVVSKEDSVVLTDKPGSTEAAVVAFIDTACVLAISDEPGVASVELPSELNVTEEGSTGDPVALPGENSILLMLE